METKRKKLTLQEYQKNYEKELQSKMIQEALIFLKLRDCGWSKKKALHFAQKKQQTNDSTHVKDGPIGFKKLISEKRRGTLINGRIKNDQIHCRGFMKFLEQRKILKQQQKFMMNQRNKNDRVKLQELRMKLQKKNQQILMNVSKPKRQKQISVIEDQLMKDNEKGNIYLSCNGVKLQEHTRNYFQSVTSQNLESLIVKLDAFHSPFNDEQITLEIDQSHARWRSESAPQLYKEKMVRKKLLNFRKFLDNVKINGQCKNNLQDRNIRSTPRSSSYRQSLWTSLARVPNKKNRKYSQQFYDKIEKIAFLKSKPININKR